VGNHNEDFAAHLRFMDGLPPLTEWWRPGPSTTSPPSGPARAVKRTASLALVVARSI